MYMTSNRNLRVTRHHCYLPPKQSLSWHTTLVQHHFVHEHLGMPLSLEYSARSTLQRLWGPLGSPNLIM